MSVYYSPETLDLVTVASLDLTEPDYSFDLLVVWRHTPTGRLYWATDSGCSCPSPFEDFHTLDDFNELVSANFADVLRIVEDSVRGGYGQANLHEASNFLRVVREALAG